MLQHTSPYSRRGFLKTTGTALAGSLFLNPLAEAAVFSKAVPVSGHLWVYASKYPPNWDCTPILDQVFSNFKYAGLEGVELMESLLRHADAVPRIGDFHLVTSGHTTIAHIIRQGEDILISIANKSSDHLKLWVK